MNDKRFLAAIVCDVAVTKREALELVAGLCGVSIQDPESTTPFVVTDPVSRAQIEIPKFGEPPPLAIDIWSTESVEHARTIANDLCAQISGQTGWKCHVDTEAR